MAWMGTLTIVNRCDSKDELMEDLMAAFKVFDKDGNGFITKVRKFNISIFTRF